MLLVFIQELFVFETTHLQVKFVSVQNLELALFSLVVFEWVPSLLNAYIYVI